MQRCTPYYAISSYLSLRLLSSSLFLSLDYVSIERSRSRQQFVAEGNATWERTFGANGNNRARRAIAIAIAGNSCWTRAGNRKGSRVCNRMRASSVDYISLSLFLYLSTSTSTSRLHRRVHALECRRRRRCNKKKAIRFHRRSGETLDGKVLADRRRKDSTRGEQALRWRELAERKREKVLKGVKREGIGRARRLHVVVAVVVVVVVVVTSRRMPRPTCTYYVACNSDVAEARRAAKRTATCLSPRG